MPGPIDNLGVACPQSGQFYVCEDSENQFMGCCTINPCTATNGGICPQENLQPTTFSPSAYPSISAQSCIGSDSGVSWYTCRDLAPPFMGCCAGNACSPGGCPATMLRAARLSEVPQDAAPFLSSPASSSTSTSTAVSSSSSATSTASTAPGQTGDPITGGQTGSSASDPGLSKGVIAGIAVGAACAALLVALAIHCWLYPFLVRRNKLHIKDQGIEGASGNLSPGHHKLKTETSYSELKDHDDAPPQVKQQQQQQQQHGDMYYNQQSNHNSLPASDTASELPATPASRQSIYSCSSSPPGAAAKSRPQHVSSMDGALGHSDSSFLTASTPPLHPSFFQPLPQPESRLIHARETVGMSELEDSSHRTLVQE